MADENQLELLERGADKWNKWREEREENVDIDLRGAQLNLRELNKVNFGWHGLFRATHQGFEAVRSEMMAANFAGTQLRESSFASANLVNSKFPNADLQDTDFSYSLLGAASLRDARLDGATFCYADLTKADLTRARLRHATLNESNLESCVLEKADLTRASFSGAKLSRSTVLDGVVFADEHDEMSDGADQIVLSRRDRLISWSRLRFLGELPIFGFSYTALALALAIGYGVHAANVNILEPLRSGLTAASSRLEEVGRQVGEQPGSDAIASQIEGLTDSVEALGQSLPSSFMLPSEMSWIVLSTLLLAIGSTIFKFLCPATIQRFTEVEWVAQLRRARLLYLRDSLGCGRRGRWQFQLSAQIATGVTVMIGGGVAVIILIVRVVRLFGILARYGTWALFP